MIAGMFDTLPLDKLAMACEYIYGETFTAAQWRAIIPAIQAGYKKAVTEQGAAAYVFGADNRATVAKAAANSTISAAKVDIYLGVLYKLTGAGYIGTTDFINPKPGIVQTMTAAVSKGLPAAAGAAGAINTTVQLLLYTAIGITAYLIIKSFTKGARYGQA